MSQPHPNVHTSPDAHTRPSVLWLGTTGDDAPTQRPSSRVTRFLFPQRRPSPPPRNSCSVAELIGDYARMAPSLGLTAAIVSDLSFRDRTQSVGLVAPLRTIFSRFDANFPYLPRGKPTTLYRGLRFAEGNGHDGRFSVPSLQFRPFLEPSSTSTDPLVVFTNGMRYQARNLYIIVYILNDLDMRAVLCVDDLERFFWWLHRFRKFFLIFMTSLNDYMLPSIRRCVPFRFSTPPYFSREGMRLCELLKKACKCERPFTTVLAPSAATKRLCWIFNEFAQPLLTYIAALEEYFAVLTASFASHAHAEAASVAMVRGVQAYPNFTRHLGMMLRWLESRWHFREDWLRRNVTPVWLVIYRKMERVSPMDQAVEQFRAQGKSILFH